VRLTGAEVVSHLVAHHERDLPAQRLGVVAEVALQRVPEHQDLVAVAAVGHGATDIHAVGAVLGPVVGDRDRDVLLQLGPHEAGKIVQRLADEALEAVHRGGRARRGDGGAVPLDRPQEAIELGLGHPRDLAPGALGRRGLDMGRHRDEGHAAERACHDRETEVAGPHREPEEVSACGRRDHRPDRSALRQRPASLTFGAAPFAVAAHRRPARTPALVSRSGPLRWRRAIHAAHAGGERRR